MPDARLIDTAIPKRPEAVVLVLHGGASRAEAMAVSPTQLSVLRMIPIAHRIARTGHRRLAVLRLLNSRRGWDTEHTPVRDVEWALAHVAERFGGDLPVGLVGHSLGGRAALLAAGQPQVKGIVALAPWVYASDVPAQAAGTPVLIIHGDGDRVASPDRAWQVAENLRRQTRVSYVSVAGGTHTMLARRDAFDGLAARAIAWMLLGTEDGPVIRRIADGEARITI